MQLKSSMTHVKKKCLKHKEFVKPEQWSRMACCYFPYYFYH